MRRINPFEYFNIVVGIGAIGFLAENAFRKNEYSTSRKSCLDFGGGTITGGMVDRKSDIIRARHSDYIYFLKRFDSFILVFAGKFLMIGV